MPIQYTRKLIQKVQIFLKTWNKPCSVSYCQLSEPHQFEMNFFEVHGSCACFRDLHHFTASTMILFIYFRFHTATRWLSKSHHQEHQRLVIYIIHNEYSVLKYKVYSLLIIPIYLYRILLYHYINPVIHVLPSVYWHFLSIDKKAIQLEQAIICSKALIQYKQKGLSC